MMVPTKLLNSTTRRLNCDAACIVGIHGIQSVQIKLLSTLGHEGLMVISGLMSCRIMGYKLKKKTVT